MRQLVLLPVMLLVVLLLLHGSIPSQAATTTGPATSTGPATTAVTTTPTTSPTTTSTPTTSPTTTSPTTTTTATTSATTDPIAASCVVESAACADMDQYVAGSVARPSISTPVKCRACARQMSEDELCSFHLTAGCPALLTLDAKVMCANVVPPFLYVDNEMNASIVARALAAALGKCSTAGIKSTMIQAETTSFDTDDYSTLIVSGSFTVTCDTIVDELNDAIGNYRGPAGHRGDLECGYGKYLVSASGCTGEAANTMNAMVADVLNGNLEITCDATTPTSTGTTTATSTATTTMSTSATTSASTTAYQPDLMCIKMVGAHVIGSGSECEAHAMNINNLLHECSDISSSALECQATSDGNNILVATSSAKCTGIATALHRVISNYAAPAEIVISDAIGQFTCFGTILLERNGCEVTRIHLSAALVGYRSGAYQNHDGGTDCSLTTVTTSPTTSPTTTATMEMCDESGGGDEECADVKKEDCTHPLYGQLVMTQCPLLCGLCRTTPKITTATTTTTIPYDPCTGKNRWKCTNGCSFDLSTKTCSTRTTSTVTTTTRDPCNGITDPESCSEQTADRCNHAIIGPSVSEECMVLCKTCPTPSTTPTTSPTTTQTTTTTATTSATTTDTSSVTTTETTSQTSTPSTTPSTTPTSTTQTTSPTTSSTPTTTGTTTFGCARGTFLNLEDGECTPCAEGTFNDNVAHETTFCTPCSTRCATAEYLSRQCSARSDIKCNACTSCERSEFTAAKCTPNSNTVCLSVSDCQSRCTFVEEANQCWPNNSPIPCSKISAADCGQGPSTHCQVQGKRCIAVNPPTPVDVRACVTGGQKDCQTINSPDGNGCRWDQTLDMCRNAECSDIYDPTYCAASSLGCTFNTQLYYCHGQADPIPCGRHYLTSLCTAADHCMYSEVSQTCVVKQDLSQTFITTAPCSAFVDDGLAACPIDRCFKDEVANICHEKDEMVPCQRYPAEHVLCPGDVAAVVREYQSAPATRTQDAACTLQRARCDRETEYEVAVATKTSDIECEYLTQCKDTEYEITVATAWSDRECYPLTECTTDQYEAIAPQTSDSEDYFVTDRTCAKATTATTKTATTSSTVTTSTTTTTLPTNTTTTTATVTTTTTATATTATIHSLCAENEYETLAPTATSDRECMICGSCPSGTRTGTACTNTTNTVCEGCNNCGVRKYLIADCSEGAPPVCGKCEQCARGFHWYAGIHGKCACSRCSSCTPDEFQTQDCTLAQDRMCQTIREPCDAIASYEAESPTKTSDRVCKDASVCSSTEFEASPLNSTSVDRVCKPTTKCTSLICASLPDSDNDEYECDSGSETNSGSGSTGSDIQEDGYICDVKFEVVAASNTSDSVCLCPTMCSAGQYERIPPGASSNRECSPCPDGQFKHTLGAHNCTVWTECTPQEWNPPELYATALRDRVCLPLSPACDEDDDLNNRSRYQLYAPTATSDRRCVQTTWCEADQWESQLPTATSNRECSTHKECTEMQFELRAPNGTANRVCESLTTCLRDWEWECAVPTKTSNRECCRVQKCDSVLQFESAAATSTSDTVCTNYTSCNSTQYISKRGRAEADRQCADITVCHAQEPVAFQVYPASEHRDAICMAATVCNVGTYEAQPPQAESNSVCKNCNGVTEYQDQKGQSTCKPIVPCEVGATFAAVAPTRERSGTCEPYTTCANDEFEAVEITPTSNRQCAKCTICEATEFVGAPCSATKNAICQTISQPCAGDFEFEALSPTNTSDRVCRDHKTCAFTEYMHYPGNSSHDADCRRISTCEPGTRQVARATSVTNRHCEPCTVGVNFTTRTNEHACTPCLTSCAPGFEPFTSCTADTDIECALCESEMYSTGQACIKWQPECASGYFEVIQPSEARDRACTPCPDGSWRNSSNPLHETGCRQWTDCLPGYIAIDGTATPSADRTCRLADTTSTTTTRTATTSTSTSSSTSGADLEAENAAASAAKLSSEMVYVVMGGIVLLLFGLLWCSFNRKDPKGDHAASNPMQTQPFPSYQTSPQGGQQSPVSQANPDSLSGGRALTPRPPYTQQSPGVLSRKDSSLSLGDARTQGTAWMLDNALETSEL